MTQQFNDPYQTFEQLPLARCGGDSYFSPVPNMPFAQDSHVVYPRQTYIANQRPYEFGDSYIPDAPFGKAQGSGCKNSWARDD